jgi:hypothetical protein
MGINAISPNQGASPLERIFGAYQMFRSVMPNAEQKQANADAAMKRKYELMSAKNQAEGVVSQKDLIAHGDNYDFSDQPTPGSIALKVQDSSGVKDVFLTPRQKTSPLADAINALTFKEKGLGISEKIKNQNSEEAKFKALPVENQEQIKDLARGVANQKKIKASIDSALSALNDPNLNELQKVKIGQNLLKTLNSEQGQDAVGAEESKRLGSLLEYKIANFTQPGSFIGRDLDAFIDQVAIQSERLQTAIGTNSASIEQLYGREPTQNVAFQVPHLRTAQGGGKGTPAANAGQEEMVPVYDPSGKPGKVPASKLAGALKSGFKKR